MDFQLPPEDMEKIFKICDILSIEDFTVASILLEQNGWDLNKAVNSLQETVQKAPPPPPPQEQFDYEFNDQQYDEQNQYQEYEQILQQEEDYQNKKKMFNNQYQSIPLCKTSSQVPNKLQKSLSYDRLLTEDYSRHRNQYQGNLLTNSNIFCQKVLQQSKESHLYEKSKRKYQENCRFISQLYSKYQTRINFTFGTFFLNLARSYLDKKFMLVYVHRGEFENNKSIEMLLTQQEIANFVNKHCISYGMFDSSDDYEILQKYVQWKDLPAFALFKFDKKGQKEQFISHYVQLTLSQVILQKNPLNFMEWLATNLGVHIKKREKQIQENKPEPAIVRPSDIIFEQNLEYEEMARQYQLKRKVSKAKKMEKQDFRQFLEKLKPKFEKQPQLISGTSIQIKFRLPFTGKTLLRVFTNDEKIESMFEFISCFGREEFEEQSADFDLTQTFPKISLMDKQDNSIGDMFEGSERQNIIVKEI